MTTADTISIDLSRFCATADDPRQHLRKPWKRGEWVYATNSHVCVRVPAWTMPDVGECDKAPPAQNLFLKHMEQRQCEFLPMPPLQAVAKCRACNGIGTVLATKCLACTDGTFGHYGDTYDCMHCAYSDAGPGWVESERESATKRPCAQCDGLGASLRQNGNVALGESSYSLVYLSWLAALPGVTVCPGSSAEVVSAEQVPAVFLFDGGQALLMPRRDCMTHTEALKMARETLAEVTDILDMALMIGLPTLPPGADGPAVKARAAIAALDALLRSEQE